MKRIAKIAILALVAVIGARPLMACMLPSAVMNAEEKACCRRMAQSCGDHTMPSSHSCCKTVASPEQIAVAKASFSLTPQFDVVYVAQSTAALGDLAFIAVASASAPDYSPPEGPPSSSDILRI